jgi:hypothetical protein
MKYAVLTAWLLLASAACAPQQFGASGYSGRPDRCLVVSPLGDKFRFRDSWIFETNKRAFKDSQLTKIQGSGIDVIRLSKDATDSDVRVVIAKCKQTLLDPVPAIVFPPLDQPRAILISEQKIQ